MDPGGVTDQWVIFRKGPGTELGKQVEAPERYWGALSDISSVVSK
jgi:hypothetical protein